MSTSRVLKDRLQQSEVLIIPGIYDSLSALIAEQAGAEAVFLSGSSLAYSQLGRPDIGLVTLSETVDACARIADRVSLPILVDVDSGFGNAAHAGRTLRLLERAGAAAIQIEDQVAVKPAGDLKGRPLVSKATMVDKIKSLLDDRRTDILISARTDSPASESIDQTLERVAAYCEAGADIVFAEGLQAAEDVARVVEVAGNMPVFYNLLHAGRALYSAAQLHDLGVSGVLFPGNAILNVASALKSAMTDLMAVPALPQDGFAMSPADLNATLGTPELVARYKDFA